LTIATAKMPVRTGLLSLLLLGASSVFHAQSAASNSGYLQQAYPVVDRVHVLHQGPGFHMQGIGDVTVVEQVDGLVLVDAGGTPGAGRRVVELVKSISPKPVKAIIITHWHGDHHFGLSEVLKAWPHATVIATTATWTHMNNRGLPAQPDDNYDAGQIKNLEATRKQLEAASTSSEEPESEHALYAADAQEVRLYEDDFRGVYIKYANLTFSDRLTLPDEVAPIEVMFLGRANTDGDAVVWLPKQKVVAVGDIVVSPIPYGGGSYPLDWVTTLEKIRALDFAVLIPGHGLPQTDRSYVDKLIAALHDVNTQITALVQQGLDADAAAKKVDFAAQQKSIVGDDPRLSDYFQGLWEDVAKCAYAQAKGIQTIQGKGCRP
jgi:glyoxylase-like metal-dependent hydrolase (beta-lactamase superfamily II)